MAEDQNRTYDAQYLLRLPSELRDRIKVAAAENTRSMNAEIIATLEEKYPPAMTELERALADFIFSVSATTAREVVDQMEKAKEEGGEKGAKQFNDFLDNEGLTEVFMDKVINPLMADQKKDLLPKPSPSSPAPSDDD